MFYFCSMWFDIFLALVLFTHSCLNGDNVLFWFFQSCWVEMFILVPQIFSFCIWTSLNSLFFFFQIRVSFTFANSTSCLECLLSFSYLIFLSPSLLAPLKCTVVNSMELRSGCWSILKTKVSHLVKSEGRQSVSSLPSHEEDLHCPMSFQPQEQRKFSQHIQPFRLFS